MRTMRAWLIAMFVTGGVALAACGGGGAEAGSGQGIVKALDRAASQVTIQHGEIPGLMQAMTMAFAVQDPALLEGIEVGEEVEFQVRYEAGTYTVTAIEPSSATGARE